MPLKSWLRIVAPTAIGEIAILRICSVHDVDAATSLSYVVLWGLLVIMFDWRSTSSEEK